MKSNIIKLVHILFTGPLLIYIGFMKPKITWIYYLLGFMGVGLLAFMIYEISTHGFGASSIWYIIHACLFAPLLLYLAWKKWESPTQLFGVVLAIGLAAVSYHLVRLMTS